MPRVTAAAESSSAVVVAEIIVGTNRHSIFAFHEYCGASWHLEYNLFLLSRLGSTGRLQTKE